MHSDPAGEYFPQISCIPDMVEISMGEQDEFKVPWLATEAYELSFKLPPGIGHASVDQIVSALIFKQIAIHMAEFERQGQSDGCNL